MGTIPQYTKGIIRERAVPNLYDPTAVQRAATQFDPAIQALDTGAQFAQKIQEADDTTLFNEKIIENKKAKMDLMESAKKERMANPQGFAKDFEKQLNDLDAQMGEALPSRLRGQWKQSTAQSNLGLYDSNLGWENKRQVDIQAERIEKTATDLSAMAFRAGKEGLGIEEVLKDVDATLVASSTVVSPEVLSGMKRKMKSEAITTWISGITETNPYAAKKILESRKYDEQLGGDGLLKSYSYIQRKIDAAERETESNENNRINEITNAFELAKMNGEANDSMYKTALTLAKTPSQKLRIEKINKSSEYSDSKKIIDYYRRIDSGQDVVEEVDFDDRLQLKDKVTLRKYQQSRDNKTAVSPEDSARKMFHDAVPEQLLKDPAMAVKLSVAKNEFEETLSNMPKSERTYENLRKAAIQKIARISNDYGRAVFDRAGIDTGEPIESRIQRRKDKLSRIIQNYNNDMIAASKDQKVIQLQKEIRTLEATSNE